MFFDRLDEMNVMMKSVSHFDNFTKWTFLVVNIIPIRMESFGKENMFR